MFTSHRLSINYKDYFRIIILDANELMTKSTSNTRLVARRIHSAARVHSRVVRQTRARGPRAPLSFSTTSKCSPSRHTRLSLAYVWDRATNWNILI